MEEAPKLTKSQKKRQKELAKKATSKGQLSMIELKERAAQRIEQIQQTNREKSMAKI